MKAFNPSSPNAHLQAFQKRQWGCGVESLIHPSPIREATIESYLNEIESYLIEIASYLVDFRSPGAEYFQIVMEYFEIVVEYFQIVGPSETKEAAAEICDGFLVF